MGQTIFTNTSIEGTIVTLGVVGELDLSNREQLRQALSALIGVPHVILDLSRCVYLDGTIIGSIVRIHKERTIPAVIVVAPDSSLCRVLQICRLSDRIPIYESAEAAVNAALAVLD